MLNAAHHAEGSAEADMLCDLTERETSSSQRVVVEQFSQ